MGKLPSRAEFVAEFPLSLAVPRRANRVDVPQLRALRCMHRTEISRVVGFHQWLGNPTISLQYWRSFEDLERYAKDAARKHRPAWAAFNRAIASNGDVGIWHETYRVRPGDFETVYNNMPVFGLARATRAVPAEGHREFEVEVSRIAGDCRTLTDPDGRKIFAATSNVIPGPN